MPVAFDGLRERLDDQELIAEGVELMQEPPDDGNEGPHDNLIKLAQARDQEAFTDLFNCYLSGICGYVAGMVRYLEDRDELVQEVFLKVWKELPKLKYVSRFKPWLYRIAANVVFDYLRYQKSRQRFWWRSLDDHLEDYEGLDNSRSFEEYIAEEELIRQALRQVSPKYRQCLLLEIEGKLSRSEIAEVTGINLQSVGAYISRGREQCRQAYQRLEQHMNDERRSRS